MFGTIFSESPCTSKKLNLRYVYPKYVSLGFNTKLVLFMGVNKSPIFHKCSSKFTCGTYHIVHKITDAFSSTHFLQLRVSCIFTSMIPTVLHTDSSNSVSFKWIDMLHKTTAWSCDKLSYICTRKTSILLYINPHLQQIGLFGIFKVISLRCCCTGATAII